jgi:uncharacterized membrane protein
VQNISSAVVCTLLGIVLANLGVIPHQSPTYEGVMTYAIPYAIVLVILASDFAELRYAGGPMLVGFALACTGSLLGGVVSGVLFTPSVGPETWKLGGQFAAAFSGGGMNFVAVGRGLETEPNIFAAATVVDNLSTVPWMLGQVVIYRWLRPWFPVSTRSAAAASPEKALEIRDRWARAQLDILDLAVLAALPLVVIWTAEQLAPLLPGFPPVLWQTTLAIVVAQVPGLKNAPGAAMAAYFALHLFFVAIGTASVISELFKSGLPLVFFMLAIIGIHAAIVYGVGRLIGLDLETVTIASQSTVGGPGSALALSMSMQWTALVTPGIIVGIFGYAIGNYIGFLTAYLTRALL